MIDGMYFLWHFPREKEKTCGAYKEKLYYIYIINRNICLKLLLGTYRCARRQQRLKSKYGATDSKDQDVLHFNYIHTEFMCTGVRDSLSKIRETLVLGTVTYCLYLRLRKAYLWTMSFASNFKWISLLLSVLSCWQREKRHFSKTSCWLRFWRMCLGLAFILILRDKQWSVNYNLTFCRSKQFFVLTFSCEICLDFYVV
jgi:hypothetical protein